mgnify:CR=1 FL=1
MGWQAPRGERPIAVARRLCRAADRSLPDGPRRYRAYDIWRSRVRTLQAAVWAAGLDGSEPTDPEWRRRLADDYRTPAVKITMEEAVAHRLRRIYLPLLVILNAAWVVRVTAFSITSSGR